MVHERGIWFYLAWGWVCAWWGELSEMATEKMGFSRTASWRIFISLEEKVREWRQIREHRRQARVFSLLPAEVCWEERGPCQPQSLSLCKTGTEAPWLCALQAFSHHSLPVLLHSGLCPPLYTCRLSLLFPSRLPLRPPALWQFLPLLFPGGARSGFEACLAL